MSVIRRSVHLLAPTLLTLALNAGGVQAQSATATNGTLYHRLGGYDVIAAVVDDFMGRFDADSALAPFLGGLNAAAGARIRQNFVDFMCARTGGPCLYNGRDMPGAHAGLTIEGRHFEAVMRHFREALDAQRVPAAARDEMLRMLAGLRTEVVTAGQRR